jgi:hypothetical protein
MVSTYFHGRGRAWGLGLSHTHLHGLLNYNDKATFSAENDFVVIGGRALLVFNFQSTVKMSPSCSLEVMQVGIPLLQVN